MAVVTGLVALPWAMDGRSGVAFKADSVAPAKGAGGVTAVGSETDVVRLQREYDRAELACDDAASAERAAFRR